MKVACFTIYPAEAPSVYHRMTAYRRGLAERGIYLDIKPFMTVRFYQYRKHRGAVATMLKIGWMLACSIRLAVNLLTIRRYDVVILHREVFPSGRPWLEKLIAGLSARCIYDLDDAIWFPPSTGVNQRSLFWYEPRTREIMSACSEVVVGNAFLENYARRHNPDVHVIPTPYDDLQPDFARRFCADGKVIVCWIGNLGNAEYLQDLKPVFEYLCARYPVVLRVIGGTDIGEIDFGAVAVELCAWNREHERSWLLGSDIGIMPLYDRGYEQGKCAFKLIQYFAAGLPVVASPVGMNKDVVVHEVNGIHASTAAQWQAGLERLIRDPDLRRAYGRQGYACFRSHFTRDRCADRWHALLTRSLDNRARATP